MTIPVSEAFEEAMRSSHRMVERVEAIDPTGQTIATLQVVGGSVTESMGALVRHSCSVTVIDEDLSPDGLKDLLRTGSGTRFRWMRGVKFWDGTEELVPLITAHIRSGEATTGGTGRGQIPLEGLDRMCLSQRKSSRPVVVPGGTGMPSAIYDLLLHSDPGLQASLMTSEWTTPQLVFPWMTDLAEEAATMAEAIGAVLYVDRYDTLVVAPRPLPTNAAVWRFAQDSPTHITARRRTSVDQVPNIVIVTGQHSSMSEPVYGVARDEDPLSPTWHGRYQQVLPITTEKATTVPQCEAYARGVLAQELGGTDTVSITVSPAPVHLTVGDVVTADYPDLDVSGNWVLHAMDTGHGPGPADIELRRGVLDYG